VASGRVIGRLVADEGEVQPAIPARLGMVKSVPLGIRS
jgi:hypothetical protein